MPVLETGVVLWRTQDQACTFAQVRHFLYRSRQQVRPVRHGGVILWRVSKACGRRA